MKVLITASASGFARKLLTELLDDDRVELAIGVDQDEADFEHERFVQLLIDPLLSQLARVLKDVDTVIHLAAAQTGQTRQAVVDSTRNLCELAVAAGMRNLVMVSSAFIYDTQIGNGPMREDHARGAPSGCTPAAALQAAEDWLDEFEREQPDLRVVRLRPHWVVGPNSNTLLARVLNGHRTPRLPEPHPAIQCIHEDDLVQAILKGVRRQVRGAFNLAGCEPTTLPALHRQARWLRIPTSPERLARHYGMENPCAELLRGSLVLDSTRARNRLGWQPRRTTPQEILKAE